MSRHVCTPGTGLGNHLWLSPICQLLVGRSPRRWSVFLSITAVVVLLGIDVRTVGDLGELPDTAGVLMARRAMESGNALDHLPFNVSCRGWLT